MFKTFWLESHYSAGQTSQSRINGSLNIDWDLGRCVRRVRRVHLSKVRTSCMLTTKITLEMFVRKCGVPGVYQATVQWLAIFSRHPPYTPHSADCTLCIVLLGPRQSRCLMINMLRVVPILHSSNSRGFNQKQILNIQYVQSIINMNIIIRQLCENPWALDASAEPWTTAELKPRQLLSEVSRRNPRLWGEVTRPLPRHGPTFSSCYQLKYWAPEIPKWLKEFHRIENKGHGGSLMSKHRLDLLFDTIKPILDVCIYSISHQINLMLSFSRI